MELLFGVLTKLFLLYCITLCTHVAATKPEGTSLSTNKSSNVFLVGEAVLLTCRSDGNPPQCRILFYQGSGTLLANVTRSLCSASHVIEKIQGCDNETFSCVTSNSDGAGPRAYRHVTVQAAPKFKIESVSDNNIRRTVTTATVAVKEGSKLDLRCSATGCPTASITRWTKQGQVGPLVTGNGRTLKYNATMKREDAGNYTCTADNGIAGAPFTSTVFVDVTYKPENTTISVNKMLFQKGERVKVTCRSAANPSDCDLLFFQGFTYKGSIKTKTCAKSFEYEIDGCGSTELSCQAKNDVAAGPRSSAIKVTVHAPPTIDVISVGKTVGQVHVVMEEGSSLELSCKATGCPTPNIKWTKLGKATDLTNGQILTLVHKFDGGLEKGDTGKYTCTAGNGIGNPSSATIYLNVTYKPIITLSVISVTLSANKQLNLTCTAADSNPPSTIQWTRNNTIIARGETLTLSAEESLPGDYTCNASNTVGSTTKKYVVKVKACDDNKCQNKASCKSKGSTFQCLCTRGYTGEFCENEDLLRDVFRIKFVITSQTWKDDYSKSESQEFKTLETKICDEIRKLFEKFRVSVLDCKVLSFREGSVAAEAELKLNQTKYNSEVQNYLRNATKNNKLGEFTLKPSSLQVSAWDACQDKPCKNDGKCIIRGNGYKCDCELFRTGDDCGNGISLAAGIVLIILACLVILFFIIAFVFFFRRNKRTRAYSTERRPIATELTSVKMRDEDGRRSDHPMAAENQIDVTDDVVVNSKPGIVVNGTDGSQIVNADDGKTGSYNINSSANNDVGKDSKTTKQNDVVDGKDNKVVNADDGKIGSYDINSSVNNDVSKDSKTTKQNDVVDGKDNKVVDSDDSKAGSHDDKPEAPKDGNAPSDKDDISEYDEVETAYINIEEEIDSTPMEESVEDNGNETVPDAKAEDRNGENVGETEDEKNG